MKMLALPGVDQLTVYINVPLVTHLTQSRGGTYVNFDRAFVEVSMKIDDVAQEIRLHNRMR